MKAPMELELYFFDNIRSTIGIFPKKVDIGVDGEYVFALVDLRNSKKHAMYSITISELNKLDEIGKKEGYYFSLSVDDKFTLKLIYEKEEVK